MGIVFIIKERNLVPKLVRQTNMFNRREKIIKKDGAKPSELEEEVAKRLHQVELENAELKKELSIILITSAQMVDYADADGSSAQYLLVRILHSLDDPEDLQHEVQSDPLLDLMFIDDHLERVL